MKIDQNAPAYPNSYKLGERCPHDIMGGCEECLGMTIRLKLIADFMCAIASMYEKGDDTPVQVHRAEDIAMWADELADAAIERANRDEPNG